MRGTFFNQYTVRAKMSLGWSFRRFARLVGFLCFLLLLPLANFLSGTAVIDDPHCNVSESNVVSEAVMNDHGLFNTYKIRRLSASTGYACSDKDISISQYPDTSSGIPQYIVQIVNTCMQPECAPSNIHLHCGWFASAKIVNPAIFKRNSYDDCLVNAGKPLKPGQIIRFTYRNSFMYPLNFKSAKFC